jgi:hypothetical protein
VVNGWSDVYQHRSASPRALRAVSSMHRFHAAFDMSTIGEMVGCPVKSALTLTTIAVVLGFVPQSERHPNGPHEGNSHGHSHDPSPQTGSFQMGSRIWFPM